MQLLIVGDKRYLAQKCRGCDHAIGRVSGECVPELAGTFRGFIRERLDTMLREPARREGFAVIDS